jgi:hypothetical protein
MTGTIGRWHSTRLVELAETFRDGCVVGHGRARRRQRRELVTAETTQATLGRIDGTLDTYSALGQRAISTLSQGEAAMDDGRAAR